MELNVLRSGSSGNSCLVLSGGTKILTDCGISGKAVREELEKLGTAPEELSGIVITHEHSDHIKGLGVLMRRYKIPVYANSATWAAIMQNDLGKLNEEYIKIFEDAEEFSIGDINIKPFEIPHDAAYPVGYRFDDGNDKCAVATDMGTLTENVMRVIGGCRTVLLESNHDIDMLDAGPYPYRLKQRIRGRLGHLSNDDAAKGAELLVKMGTENIILGHLSRENNYPQLAFETVKSGLSDCGIKVERDLMLRVAT